MKKIGLVTLFSLVGIWSLAQDTSLRLVNPLPISPQAASFAKYGDIPVSLNSGVANISIPITEVKTGEISFPVTLSYNPSGIRIEEIASNVGLGWTLHYTGSITRQVRGLPDEGSNGFFSTGSDVQQYIHGSMTSGQRESFLTSCRNGFIDGQPDIYYYNLPGGQSGKFFIDSNNHIVCFPETNLKIEISPTLANWKITSDRGIQYFFNAVETTTSATISVANGVGADGNTTYGNSSWLLTKITDPGGNEVDFAYNQITSHYSNKAVETYKVRTGGNADGGDIYTFSTTTNDIAGQRIASIQWREGEIKFSYANAKRLDLQTTDTALSAITISNSQNKMVKSFRLYTSYYSNTPTSNMPYGDSTYYSRLRLDSIQEIGTAGLSIPPYKFDYNPLSLESRNSDNQDTWGYFNGKSNTMFVSYSPTPAAGSPKLGADKSVDTNYTQADLLQRIHYPTGGSTLFEYENNKFAQYQSDTTFGFSTSSFGGISGSNGDHSDPNQYAYDFDSTFMISSANATYDGTAVVLSEMDSACSVPGSDYCILTVKLYNSDGSLIRQLKAADTLYLPPGNYTLRGHIETEFGAGSLDMEGYYSFFDESLYLATVQLPGYYDQYAGGVRTKRVTTDDGYKVTGIKEFYYNTFGQSYSSGSIGYNDNVPQYYHPESDISTMSSAFYNVYSSTSNYPLTTSGGGYVTYANVEEVEKDSTGKLNGKSDYYYTTFADHGDGNDVLDYPFPPTCSFEWQRGLILRQDDFRSNSDGSFSLVRQKFNNYTFVNDSTFRGVDGFLMAPQTIFSGEYSDSEVNAGYVQSEFQTVAQVYYLQSDSTILYSTSGDGSKVITTNLYNYKNDPILLQWQETAASNGDIKKAVFKYPGDFASYGFVSAMDSANDIATPIEVIGSRIKPLGQELINNGVITSFKPGQLSKDKIYTVQTAQDILASQFQMANINSSGLLQMDSAYQLFLQFNRYDGFGNIVEEQKANDLLMCYLWDYGHTAPIAAVKNADSASIAYTSFEADGSGNWSVGSGTVDTARSITGRNSYSLNGSISKSGLNPAVTYIVSYWSQNGSYSISGTLSGYPVQGKTVSFNNPGWTLYVHKVTGQSTITVSGIGHIDELRLYPSAAQMTTYTYDPLIGMTSQTDAGSRITYYEYDGLARLKRIRDQDYNILKAYDYQYQGIQSCGSGCYAIAMQTANGAGSLGYPVGVFDIHDKLLGNAYGPSAFVSLWNSDTADARIGTLSVGSDSTHFNITLNTGQTLPSGVTGRRYYQWDIPWTNIDGLFLGCGAYVDWGDGRGMPIPQNAGDTTHMDDSTHLLGGFSISHNYPDTTLKTITIYHNDGAEPIGMDNANSPATSLNKVRHLRGNLPQHTTWSKFSSFQQAGALTMDSIYNWNTITSLTALNLNTGDNGLTRCENVNYAQDFMKNNRGLQQFTTGYGGYSSGVYDTTFKISRLKSDWNTYFTQLNYLIISDDHWNREDISALTHLQTFAVAAGNRAGHSAFSTIPASVSDNILSQLATGAGQNVSNGLVVIYSNGGGRTSASDSAVSFLKGKGWMIYMDGVIQ